MRDRTGHLHPSALLASTTALLLSLTTDINVVAIHVTLVRTPSTPALWMCVCVCNSNRDHTHVCV